LQVNEAPQVLKGRLGHRDRPVPRDLREPPDCKDLQVPRASAARPDRLEHLA
jgi:hypothetical protein